MKWYKLPKNIENTYFNFIINRRKRIMDKSKKLPPNKNQCCGLNLGCYEFVKMQEKIKELETKLEESENKVKGFKIKELEKAFELACEPRDDWGGEKYSGTEYDNYYDYFMAEAKEMLDNE